MTRRREPKTRFPFRAGRALTGARGAAVALALGLALASFHAAACGGGGGGDGGGGGGAGGGGGDGDGAGVSASTGVDTLGTAVSVAPAVVAIAMPGVTAQTVTVNMGTEPCQTDFACDPWLKDQFKASLKSLLSAYYAVSLGDGSAGPEEVEVVSELAAKLIGHDL